MRGKYTNMLSSKDGAKGTLMLTSFGADVVGSQPKNSKTNEKMLHANTDINYIMSQTSGASSNQNRLNYAVGKARAASGKRRYLPKPTVEQAKGSTSSNFYASNTSAGTAGNAKRMGAMLDAEGA